MRNQRRRRVASRTPTRRTKIHRDIRGGHSAQESASGFQSRESRSCFTFRSSRFFQSGQRHVIEESLFEFTITFAWPRAPRAQIRALTKGTHTTVSPSAHPQPRQPGTRAHARGRPLSIYGLPRPLPHACQAERKFAALCDSCSPRSLSIHNVHASACGAQEHTRIHTHTHAHSFLHLRASTRERSRPKWLPGEACPTS